MTSHTYIYLHRESSYINFILLLHTNMKKLNILNHVILDIIELISFLRALANCLCDLVVGVPGYRSRGPGSIPSAVRFSEK
jgi:hypothetical protein